MDRTNLRGVMLAVGLGGGVMLAVGLAGRGMLAVGLEGGGWGGYAGGSIPACQKQSIIILLFLGTNFQYKSKSADVFFEKLYWRFGEAPQKSWDYF